MSDAGGVGDSSRSRLAESVGKWIAVFGSVVAVGQAGSNWVSGYWQAEAQKEKSAQELALTNLKEKSELAKEYLQLILAKDTGLPAKVMLWGALSKLDGHPLQDWAKEQYKVYQENLSHLLAAYKSQNDAAQIRDGAERQLASLSADIDTLNSQIEIEKDNPDRRQELQLQRIAKSTELGRVRATFSVVTLQVEENRTVITRSEQGLPAQGPTSSLAEAIRSISAKMDPTLLMKVFPERARKNIEANAQYLQAALQEFRISDKKLASSIIATIVVEDPAFEAYEESVEQGKKYENRQSLGNIEPGDGVKFRGRGYIGLTGRTNYSNMSRRLGLGSRLIDSPDDAKSPEVASRLLIAWFVDRQDQLSSALDRGDLGAIRRAVSGASNQLDRFTTTYNKVLAEL